MSADAAAKGKAADARDKGLKNKIKGFEIGGNLRRASNAIVHAEPGQGLKNLKSSIKLEHLSKK